MFQFLCFAVTVDPATKTVKSREGPDSTYLAQAANEAAAVEQAANHVPLHLGEQLAVVKVGAAKS